MLHWHLPAVLLPYRVNLLCVSSDTAYPASVQPSQSQFNPIGSLCSGIPIEYIPPLPWPAMACHALQCRIPYALALTHWSTMHIIRSTYPFYHLLRDESLLCDTASHCIIYICGVLHGPALYHHLTLLHCIGLHCGSDRWHRVTIHSAINDDSEACGCVDIFIPLRFKWVSGQCCGYRFWVWPYGVCMSCSWWASGRMRLILFFSYTPINSMSVCLADGLAWLKGMWGNIGTGMLSGRSRLKGTESGVNSPWVTRVLVAP